MTNKLNTTRLDAIRARVADFLAAEQCETEARDAWGGPDLPDEPITKLRLAYHEARKKRVAAQKSLEMYADEDIPALLAHIDALEAENAALKAQNRELDALWSQACAIAQKWNGQEVVLRYVQGDTTPSEDAD